MAKLLNSGMSGATAIAGYDSDKNPDLEDGENYCSPQDEQMLERVMASVYRSVNDPKALHTLRAWFIKNQHQLGVTVGNVTFTLLLGVYKDAKQGGVTIPVTVFLAQGGAIYQTIDMLINIAEHCGIQIDADQAREDAMGFVLDKVRQNYDILKGNAPVGGPQLNRAPVPQQAAAANPLSNAVSQGLMGGQQ